MPRIKSIKKDDIIKYNNEYFIVLNISPDKKTYEINYIKSKKPKTESKFVKENDVICSNTKIQQQKILTYLKFVDRYNLSIKWLNDDFNLLSDKANNVDKDMQKIFDVCRLQMKDLNKIHYSLKKTTQKTLQLHYLFINPFKYFITEQYQCIPYKSAEHINYVLELNIDFKHQLQSWCYDFFLRKNNTFYIKQEKFYKDITTFCIEKKQSSNIRSLLTYIKTNVIIEKTIKNGIYITSNYFLNFEKTMTDLMLDLFHEKTYNIPVDKITRFIEEYEIEEFNTTKNNNKTEMEMFKLENEQKDAVIQSIINKLYIITGPPGTGKTTIVKCINYVLFKLYGEAVSPPTDGENDDDLNKYIQDINDELYDCDDSDDDSGEGKNNINDVIPLPDFNYETAVSPKQICLMAPTGLAFLNMTKKQKKYHYNEKISGTCHRVLYQTMNNIKTHRTKCKCKKKCKYRYEEIKLIVIDESSMLDTFLFNDVLINCRYFNSRLIILGDTNQLPSVGPGLILNKLLESNIFNDTKLQTIKRQKEGQQLIKNIQKMTQPENNVLNITDFTDESMCFIPINNFYNDNEIIEKSILDIVHENTLDQKNSKFITYFGSQKFTFNTNSINKILQNIYNPILDESEYRNTSTTRGIEIEPPHKHGGNKTKFRVGDFIIRTENDYSSDTMRANGEPATIEGFDEDDKTVFIEYQSDQTKVSVGIEELYEMFMLNYCITIHKSQGSQYENVVLLVQPNQLFMNKQAIYTGTSRAEKKCIIISKMLDFVKIQKNTANTKVSLFMEESDVYSL
jgi:hypothetical protein